MTIHIDSARFGPLDLPEEQLVHFPHGLIGIPGSDYVLIDLNPGGVFRWLHSVEHPAFALPVVDPFSVLPSFAFALDAAAQRQIGVTDPSKADVYVTVHASSDPAKTTVNLRAPIVIHERRGLQTINTADGADLRAPLLPELESGARPSAAASSAR